MNQTGFPISRLGQLSEKIGSGITPTGGESSYVAEGVALIRSQNVLDGKLDLRRVARITNEQHRLMLNSSVRPFDVLLNITGASIGRTCVVPNDLSEANVNQHVCIIRCGPKLFPSFLYQYLASDQGQRQIDLCQAGGNRQGLNYQQIGGFQIPLPPIEEQQAIATVLSIWDRGINLLADLIDVKCRLKQGLMQQLLTGKRRFKGSREDWRIIQLRDVISECEERNRGQLGLNSVMAVTKAEGIIPMREGTIGADIGRYLIVRKNWFAYNPMRLNIGSIARWSGDREIVVSPDYVVFRCKDFNGDGLGSDV